jgi:hypothetical protein
MIIVIGNGKSRKHLDLNFIKKNSITFGCNALYRDFTPHYLLSTDSKMIHEIVNSGYPIENEFYIPNLFPIPGQMRDFLYQLDGSSSDDTIENERTNECIVHGNIHGNFITWLPDNHKVKYLEWNQNKEIDSIDNMLSGHSCIRLAIEKFPEEKKIYIIGFDIFGDRNNIYDGTNAYEKHIVKPIEERSINCFKSLTTKYNHIIIKRLSYDEKKIDGVTNISEEELWQELQHNQKI